MQHNLQNHCDSDGSARPREACQTEEHGGALAGELIVIERDRTTGKETRIDRTQMGSGAYTIPSSVEHLKFETKAKFILAAVMPCVTRPLISRNAP